MASPPVMRIFFALDLPEKTKLDINDYIGRLKKLSNRNAIRWTKPENLHITLQFLAEVHVAHVEALVKNVKNKLKNAKLHPIQLHFGKILLFPSPYRPRVIVLEVTPQEELALLSNVIGQAIEDTDYTIETRPFRGHLTIGRLKYVNGVDMHFLSKVDFPQMDAIEFKEVSLFRSEPQENGSRYTPLERLEIVVNTSEVS